MARPEDWWGRYVARENERRIVEGEGEQIVIALGTALENYGDEQQRLSVVAMEIRTALSIAIYNKTSGELRHKYTEQQLRDGALALAMMFK